MESVMEVVEGYVDSRLAEMIVQLRELKDVATGKEEGSSLIKKIRN